MMQNQAELGLEETKESSPMGDRVERRYSEQIPHNSYEDDGGKYRKSSHSPESGEFVDDISNENPQVQVNVEKMKIGTPDKHPSKMLQKKH